MCSEKFEAISDNFNLNDSSPKQLYKTYSKETLTDQIMILQKENKKLRLDNARLRALRCLSEDKLPLIKSMSNEVIQNLQILNKNVYIASKDKEKIMSENFTTDDTKRVLNNESNKTFETLSSCSQLPEVNNNYNQREKYSSDIKKQKPTKSLEKPGESEMQKENLIMDDLLPIEEIKPVIKKDSISNDDTSALLIMYYVVIWDEFTLTVSHCWVDLNEKTFKYPPNTHNMTKLTKKMIPAEEDWEVAKYRKIFGPYSTYDEARKIEKSIVNVSTSDDAQIAALNVVEKLPAKRLIKPKKFYGDSEENNNNMPSTSKKSRIIEHPPSNYKIHEENGSTFANNKISRTNSLHSSSIIGSMENVENNTKKQISIYNNNQTADTTRNIVPHLKKHSYSIQVFDSETDETDTNFHDGISDEENLPNAEEINDNEQNHSYNDDELITNDQQINDKNQVLDPEIVLLPLGHVNGNNDIREVFDSIKLIGHQLNQMRNEITKNRTILSEVLAILKDRFPRNEGNNEVAMDLVPDLPFTSVEEYIQFNETLKNDETIRKCFEKKIQSFGGDSLQKTISNILTNCLTFEVGYKLSWTGAKNTVAIANSTFANSIIGVVSRTKGGPDCTIALIVKHIRNWLQHSGDKMRYRLKKAQAL